MKKTVLFFVFSLLICGLYAQEQVPEVPVIRRINIGLGMGLDYGGFGGRFTVLPTERVEIFGAVGYNLLGVGFNGGAAFRISPQKRFCPYAGAMYGYNAVIKIIGADQYNKIYYGPSFNLGLEFWTGRKPNFLNMELLVPLRSSEYKNDLNDLKNNPSIEFKSEPLPIGISIGFHFAL